MKSIADVKVAGDFSQASIVEYDAVSGGGQDPFRDFCLTNGDSPWRKLPPHIAGKVHCKSDKDKDLAPSAARSTKWDLTDLRKVMPQSIASDIDDPLLEKLAIVSAVILFPGNQCPRNKQSLAVALKEVGRGELMSLHDMSLTTFGWKDSPRDGYWLHDKGISVELLRLIKRDQSMINKMESAAADKVDGWQKEGITIEEDELFGEHDVDYNIIRMLLLPKYKQQAIRILGNAVIASNPNLLDEALGAYSRHTHDIRVLLDHIWHISPADAELIFKRVYAHNKKQLADRLLEFKGVSDSLFNGCAHTPFE